MLLLGNWAKKLAFAFFGLISLTSGRPRVNGSNPLEFEWGPLLSQMRGAHSALPSRRDGSSADAAPFSRRTAAGWSADITAPRSGSTMRGHSGRPIPLPLSLLCTTHRLRHVIIAHNRRSNKNHRWPAPPPHNMLAVATATILLTSLKTHGRPGTQSARIKWAAHSRGIVCSCILALNTASISAWWIADLVEPWGYPLEHYTVQTHDGFLLGLFRIPTGRSNSRDSGSLSHRSYR